MTTTLEHTETMAKPHGGGLARRQNFATALICGVVFAWVFWFIARHSSGWGVTTSRPGSGDDRRGLDDRLLARHRRVQRAVSVADRT